MEATQRECLTCGGHEFNKDEGFYYCEECGTKAAGAVDLNYDLNIDYGNIRLKSRQIRKQKPIKKKDDLLTSWACYNYILVGLVKELQGLGASEMFKITTLQLWTAYLGKIEVAFTSKTKQKVPKLPVTFKKRDAQILYNRFIKMKRKRVRTEIKVVKSVSLENLPALEAAKERAKLKRALVNKEYDAMTVTQQSDKTSVYNVSLQSLKSATTSMNTDKSRQIQLNKKARREKLRTLSERHLNEHLKDIKDELKCHNIKKEISASYLASGNFVTRTVLWSILYLALNISQEEIQLGDLIRFCRDGSLTYYDFRHFFPEDYPMLKKDEHVYQSPIYDPPNHLRIRKISVKIAKIIGVKYLSKPNLINLSRRYCLELQLPENVNELVAKLCMLTEPVMCCRVEDIVAVPNFEGRAMSLIIFVLKLILGLNDETEIAISNSVDKLNHIFIKNGLDKQLFDWNDWFNYIETRKLTLCEKHFPTKMLVDPTYISSEMYFNFLRKVKCENHVENEALSVEVFKKVFRDLEAMQYKDHKEEIEFKPSLTPNMDNLKRILMFDRRSEVSDILQKDFTKSNLKLILHSKELKKICEKCNVDLKFETELQNMNTNFVGLFHFHKKQSQDRSYQKHYFEMYVIAKDCRNDIHDTTINNKKEKLPEELEQHHRKLSENQISLRSHFNKKSKTDKIDNEPCTKKARLNLNKTNVQEIGRLMLEEQLSIVRTPGKVNLNVTPAKDSSIISKKNIGRSKSGKFVPKTSSKALPEASFKRRRNGKWFLAECIENELNERNDSENNENSLLNRALKEKRRLKVKEKTSNTMNCKTEICVPVSSYWINHGDPNGCTNQLFNELLVKLPRNFQWLLKECASVLEMDCKELYTDLMVVENQYGFVLNSGNVDQNVQTLEKKLYNVEHNIEESIANLKKYW